MPTIPESHNRWIQRGTSRNLPKRGQRNIRSMASTSSLVRLSRYLYVPGALPTYRMHYPHHQRSNHLLDQVFHTRLQHIPRSAVTQRMGTIMPRNPTLTSREMEPHITTRSRRGSIPRRRRLSRRRLRQQIPSRRVRDPNASTTNSTNA